MAGCCDLPDYWDDQLEPTWGLIWRDRPPNRGGIPIDFSSSAFELEFRRPRDTVVRTKTTGIVGGNGGVDPTNPDPNVVVTWQAGDFTGLSGNYYLRLKEETTDLVLDPMPRIRIRPAVA